MKKVLAIFGVLILIAGCGVGGYFAFKYYKDYNTQLQQNASLTAQNAQVQAQIDAIGAMGVAYEVVAPKKSGDLIQEADLKEVSVPTSIYGDASITTKEDLIGKHYRIDVTTGTLLTKDMLMAEDQTVSPKFSREFDVASIPVKLEPGDFIDIKFMIANGEEYVIIPHIEVQAISGSTISINITEEESQLITSAVMDIAHYPSACLMYIDMYLEPGNADSIAFYPVQADMEQFILFNPNITDTTRCINTTMRAHIDQCLTLYSNSNNQENASKFIEGMKAQLESRMKMREEYIKAKEEAIANGELVEEPQQETVADAVVDAVVEDVDTEAIE